MLEKIVEIAKVAGQVGMAVCTISEALGLNSNDKSSSNNGQQPVIIQQSPPQGYYQNAMMPVQQQESGCSSQGMQEVATAIRILAQNQTAIMQRQVMLEDEVRRNTGKDCAYKMLTGTNGKFDLL